MGGLVHRATATSRDDEQCKARICRQRGSHAWMGGTGAGRANAAADEQSSPPDLRSPPPRRAAQQPSSPAVRATALLCASDPPPLTSRCRSRRGQGRGAARFEDAFFGAGLGCRRRSPEAAMQPSPRASAAPSPSALTCTNAA